MPNKGLNTLIEAYMRSDFDRSEWPLVLMGDGPLRGEIERQIRESGVMGIVDKGQVDETTRNDTIRHARWMVTPPNTREDLGLTPFEARSVGVPCIITRDGGLPEAGGQYALSCEPGSVEELKHLLEKAAHMEMSEYERLAEATHKELLDSLQPLSVYLDHYKEVLA